MAFFDEIGKKFSQTGQMAVQKTKEIADIAKLNSNISDEEKKISNAFYQIGQLYVELHSDDFEPDFEALLVQLRESQNNVETLKRQIQEIKGVKRCTACGVEMPNNATFCSSCGTAVVQQKAVDAADLIKCINCGKLIEKGMKFCTFCGTKVITQQDQNPENKCLYCGVVLDNGVAFCTNCGKPVQNEEANIVETNDGNNISDDISIQPMENQSDFSLQGQNMEQPAINMPKSTAQVIEKRCANCGAVLDKDSLFCTECGTKVD